MLKPYYIVLLFLVFSIGCAAPLSTRKGPTIEEDPFLAFSEKYRLQAAKFEAGGDLHKALFFWEVVYSFIPDDIEASERIRALKAQIRVEADRHFRKGVDHVNKNLIHAARKEFLIALTYNPDHEQALDYLRNKLTEQDYIFYETKKGDTLKRIAKEIYNDSGKDFLVAYFNTLEGSEELKPGMTLKLPIIEPELTGKPTY